MRVNATNHAAIEQADHAVAQHPDIAGVRVGMKKSIAENHVEIDIRAARRQFLRVHALRLDLGDMPNAHPVEHFHRQNAPGGKFGKRLRDVNRAVAREIAGKFFEIAPLAGKIEFAQQVAPKLRERGARLVRLQRLVVLLR